MLVHPEDDVTRFALRLKKIERELAALARSRTLTHASVHDDDGNRRITLGNLGDGAFGFMIQEPGGEVVFRVDEEGLWRPVMSIPVRAVNPAHVPVTSATFVSTHEVFVPVITHAAVRAVVVVTKDNAGDDGELRFQEGSGVSPTLASAVRSLSGSWTQRRFQLDWEPAWGIGDVGPFQWTVSVRRSSGTGNINVFPPDAIYLAAPSEIGAGGGVGNGGGSWSVL